MQMGLSNISITNHHSELRPHLNRGHSAESSLTPAKKLTINALHYSVNGGVTARRKNADGNYYTLSFPDDFVKDKNKATSTNGIPDDPFFGYRDADGKINTSLDLTIQIPHGMSVGTNTAGYHAVQADIKTAHPILGGWWGNLGTWQVGFGDGTTVEYPESINHPLGTGHNFYTIDLLHSDPCILVDFNTDKVTSITRENCNITIENSGNTIGGGGVGGYGGHLIAPTKNEPKEPGGGGGGGQGLHQVTIGGSSIVGADREYILGEASLSGIISSDGYDGPVFAGIGGVSGGFDTKSTTKGAYGAANGAVGTLAANGAGGVEGPVSADRSDSSALHSSHAFAGGNVIYFRSNVATSSARGSK